MLGRWGPAAAPLGCCTAANTHCSSSPVPVPASRPLLLPVCRATRHPLKRQRAALTHDGATCIGSEGHQHRCGVVVGVASGGAAAPPPPEPGVPHSPAVPHPAPPAPCPVPSPAVPHMSDSPPLPPPLRYRCWCHRWRLLLAALKPALLWPCSGLPVERYAAVTVRPGAKALSRAACTPTGGEYTKSPERKRITELNAKLQGSSLNLAPSQAWGAAGGSGAL